MGIFNQSLDEKVNAIDSSKKEFTESKIITRKPLREWGFEEAGLNRGDSIALESHLRWIQQGHIVDETYNADEQIKRSTKVSEDISNKEKSQINIEKDKQHVSDVIIPDKDKLISILNKDIESKKIEIAEGRVASTFNGARFWLYATLSVLITFYLIFFYASAIYASFFRSMQQMVNSGSNDDVTLMLNSIFDVKGIFQLSPQLIFTYLGAFIFFGFGILPHIFLTENSKYKTIKVTLSIIICLIVDALLAYKIDSGIHELKLMMGLPDADWVWFKSINFYLVIAFGFGTYMLWGFLYEAALSEYEKKNVNVKAEIEIKGLKVKIREIENEILSLKEKIKDLQKQIDALTIEIKNLRELMEKAYLKPEELRRNMENFYAGWLGFLNGISENNMNKTSCELVYKKIQESLSETNK